jgi:hypothetical protein
MVPVGAATDNSALLPQAHQPLVEVGLALHRVDGGGGVEVHPVHGLPRLGIVGVQRGRAEGLGQLGGPHRGGAGEDAGDRGRPRPAVLGVVRQAEGHEGGAEVGVAHADVARGAGLDGDLVGRVVGGADEDVLGGHDHPGGVHEPLHVERAVLRQKRHEVE